MTAPTKNFTTIPNSSIDADSPIDETLLTAIRDALEHLEEWLGKDFVAAQNHNHDGVNSAAIEIGPNLIRNGSFESGTTGWTVTQYTGGTVATNTANDMDGATALAFTSTVLANGGGDALSSEFIACTGDGEILVKWSQKASAANISSKVEVLWYDDAQSSISTTVLHTTINTNTTAKKRQRIAIAPTAARYCKVKITGGIPATGSATGTVYFDGVKVTEPVGALVLLDEITSASTSEMVFGESVGGAIIDSTFDHFEFHFIKITPATSDTTFRCQFSNDGGATFHGATGYLTSGSAATTYWDVAVGDVRFGAAFGGFSGVMRVCSPSIAASDLKNFYVDGSRTDGTTATRVAASLVFGNTGKINGFRFYVGTGNFFGTIRLYGVRKGA